MNFLRRFYAAAQTMSRAYLADPFHKLLASLVLAAALGGGAYALVAPPLNFVPESLVTVARGASVADVAGELANAHVIAHPLLLRLLLRATGTSGDVQAGRYRFAEPETVFTVAYRLTRGAYDLPAARVTLTEGMTTRDMADRIVQALPDVSPAAFLAAAAPYEGYLFPDTYFFDPSDDAARIVAVMRANFDTKIALLLPAIHASGHSLSDIVTMASLLEKEARTSADRRIVAGILWNRIRLGMPLQVDAVFGYIFNRDTYAPSLADLKADSPYNTYTHRGLPPGPIDNPGLDSLEAAAHPASTKYLYYLTGTDGQMRYAATYAGHQANLLKYLR